MGELVEKLVKKLLLILEKRGITSYPELRKEMNLGGKLFGSVIEYCERRVPPLIDGVTDRGTTEAWITPEGRDFLREEEEHSTRNWREWIMLLATFAIAVSTIYYSNATLRQQETFNQPLVIPTRVGCPPNLSNPLPNYISPQYRIASISFSLINMGKSPTAVTVYIEKHGINFTSTGLTYVEGIDSFGPEGTTPRLVDSLFFDSKGTPISYSFNLNPDISNTPPAEISFKIYYTYTMLDGTSTSPIAVLNCKYALNESTDKSTWAVVYNLKT